MHDTGHQRRGSTARSIVVASVVVALAVLTFFLLTQTPYGWDLRVYRFGGAAFFGVGGTHQVLYGPLVGPTGNLGLPFTYPPFAAMFFAPMALVPAGVALVVCMLAAALLAAGTALVVSRYLAEQGVITLGSQARHLAPAVVFAVIINTGPWRDTIGFGQVNILLMVLVGVDVLFLRGTRYAGLLTGLAAGIKLTPLCFGLIFLVRRDIPSLVRMCAGGLGTVVLAWIIAPGLSVQYWRDVLLDPSRIGHADYVDNLSWKGFLLHAGLGPEGAKVGWVVGSVLLIGVVAVIMTRLLARADVWAALGCNAMLGLLISPVSWSHHWVWIALIVPAWLVSLRAAVPPGTLRSMGYALLAATSFAFLFTPRVIAGLLTGTDPDKTPLAGVTLVLSSVSLVLALGLLGGWALLARLPYRISGPRASQNRDDRERAPAPR